MHSLYSHKKALYGYLRLSEYIDMLDDFEKKTRWKLPLSFMDKVHLFILKVVNKHSWFSNSLYVEIDSEVGLGYEQIVNTFKKTLGDVHVRKMQSNPDLPPQSQWRLFMKNAFEDLQPLSYGSDPVNEVALSKAIGEGLERYFFLWQKFNSHKSIQSTYGNLQKKGHDAYYPSQFHTYTVNQIEENNFPCVKTNTVLEWVTGVNLITGKSAYIPKQLISRTAQRELSKTEGVIHEITSNGAAGWFTKEGAITRGIFELVQRDTFLVAWLTHKQFDAIDIRTIQSPEIKKLIEGIQNAKVKLCILNGENEFKLPTAIVLVTDTCFEEEQVSVTAHTDATFEKALLSALYEVYPYFFQKNKFILASGFKPFISKEITRTERINLWRGREASVRLEKLYSGNTISAQEIYPFDIQSESEKEILDNVVSRFGKLGEEFTPYYYEVQNPFLKKIGYNVVKSFVPSLFPFYLSEHLATIASKRLGTFTLSNHDDVLKAINTYPHPFP